MKAEIFASYLSGDAVTTSGKTFFRLATTSIAVSAFALLSSAAQAAEAPSCNTVRFADVGWTDITATTAVVSEVLKGLGYKTSTQVLSVPQFALLPWRTVAQNVGLGLELRGVSKDQSARIVAEKLELVGLGKWGHKYAHELSGGMQQRVGLARAFATDADILLMDEPFSALDPLIREHLQQELLQLQKALKKTIVFVSHDLDEAIKLGNHITIMDGGRIVQSGEAEQIVLNPVNAYVREFVAHMNPIKVLRGSSLMTPLARLARREGSSAMHPKQVPCWITHTNARTHEIIRSGFDRSPMFTGKIEG
ncbi:hypothetical protein B566_EDAN019245, partial [Ephemera danica]